MSKSNFSEEFKRDAVRQITERGYMERYNARYTHDWSASG